jgi:hypothetical protein
MDPERVRAYLQVACAGLGFDIGEIWWSTNEEHGSAIAAIGTCCWFVLSLLRLLLYFVTKAAQFEKASS